jgi:hypothetical protein
MFWEYEEMSIDSVMMTTYSGGVYDSIGDTIANIIGIILCIYVAKKWMDSVQPTRASTRYEMTAHRLTRTSSPRKYKQIVNLILTEFPIQNLQEFGTIFRRLKDGWLLPYGI